MEKAIPTIEVYENEPEGFSPHVHAAACYIEIEGKLLLLQRPMDKLEPGKWGVPGGKLEENETPAEAAVRELFEETGIAIKSPSQVHYLISLYMRKPEVDYVFHMFKITLDQCPEVVISKEHMDCIWATVADLETLPLMDGAQEALQAYRSKLEQQ